MHRTEGLVHTQHRLQVMYAVYRVALATVLVGTAWLSHVDPLIGALKSDLYTATTLVYWCITGLGALWLWHAKTLSQWQQTLMLLLDIGVFTLLMYMSGGPTLQLSMLYLVCVVAAHALLMPRSALFVAVLAAIAVIYPQFLYALLNDTDPRNVAAAGLLGFSFLAVSLLGQRLTAHLREALAQSQWQTLHMEQLRAMSRRAIADMPTGVMVFDDQYRIVFGNDAARTLLQLTPVAEGNPKFTQPCPELLPAELAHALDAGLDSGLREWVWQSSNGKALGLRVAWMDQEDERVDHVRPLAMVWIEDLQRSLQQAQQLKLALLGRLTASIAHEIRNPLAAIAQANELLLADVGAGQRVDPALLTIIETQARRMNRIITDVLQLSRRDQHPSTRFELAPWLRERLVEYPLTADQGHMVVQLDAGLWIRANADQLQQVLENLLQNALYHGAKVMAQPPIEVRAFCASNGANHSDKVVIIDVCNPSHPMSEAVRNQLFEPFFTTEKQGTGLGLYISRSLCEANGAQLDYISTANGGCFRITMSWVDPEAEGQ